MSEQEATAQHTPGNAASYLNELRGSIGTHLQPGEWAAIQNSLEDYGAATAKKAQPALTPQPSPPGSGEEGMAVPPDKDAVALVEAIQELCTEARAASVVDVRSLNETQYNLGVIRDDATRLMGLLADRDAEREELVTAAEEMMRVARAAQDRLVTVSPPERGGAVVEMIDNGLARARTALARVKGAS